MILGYVYNFGPQIKISNPYVTDVTGKLYAAYETAISNVAFQGTAAGSTMTFTAGNAADFRLGDYLFWDTSSLLDANKKFLLPFLKVTAINGSTVTATLLFDNVYQSAPASVRLAVPLFVNKIEATATTTGGSATLTAVTQIGNFQIGDFVSGTNLPAGARITAIDSGAGTITLNKNATGSGTGVAVYNCRLTSM